MTAFGTLNLFVFFRLSKCWLKTSDQEKRHANGTIDASGDDVDEGAVQSALESVRSVQKNL